MPSIMRRTKLDVTAALAGGLAFVGLPGVGIGQGAASAIAAAAGFSLFTAESWWKLRLPRHPG